MIIDSTITSGTKTHIGTKKEYEHLRKLIDRSGLMIVSCKLGSDDIKGTCNAVNFATGIDFGCPTNFGGSAKIVSGTIELGTGANKDKCYVTMAMTAVGSNAKG